MNFQQQAGISALPLVFLKTFLMHYFEMLNEKKKKPFGKNKEALKLSVMLWGVTDALLEMHHLPTAHSNVTAF